MRSHFSDPLKPAKTRSPRAAPAMPRLALLGLLALVLLGHLAVLQNFFAPSLTRISPATGSFQTRLLPTPMATAPAAAPAQPPVKEKVIPLASVETPVAQAVAMTQPATAVQATVSASALVTGPAPALLQPAAPRPDLPPLALPPSRKLLYQTSGEARGSAYNASSELLWERDGDNYRARAEVSVASTASRVQTSVGALTPQGLAPRRFGDKVRSEVAAHFERDKGVIIFSASTSQAALLPGAQDHLSLFIQFAGLLAGDPARYPTGSVIELQAVGPRDAEVWQFVVDGEELLQLPGGELPAVKLRRVAQKKFDVTVELWLAPQLDYLPARIRLTQNNGDFVDQQWRASEAP